MKSMVIGGIILIIALLAGTYLAAGDAFIGDDYINSLAMLGAVAIITISVFVVLKYVNQMKNDTASGDLAEEKWDGIGEYKNPIPTGWALAFIGTIVWMFTTMRITQTYDSKQDRDGALASGLDQGMEAGYMQLDAVLAQFA